MDCPTNIRELAQALQIPFSALQVPCIFCKNHLGRVDLQQFVYKSLSLVWREGWPYGVCVKCLAMRCRVQVWRGYEASVDVTGLEKCLGERFGDQLIRCLVCLSPLTPLDKVDMVAKNRQFHKISGNFRGTCRSCSVAPGVLPAVEESTSGLITSALAELRR